MGMPVSLVPKPFGVGVTGLRDSELVMVKHR